MTNPQSVTEFEHTLMETDAYRPRMEYGPDREGRDRYRAEERRLRDHFLDDLRAVLFPTLSPGQAQPLLQLAWEQGHANGYHEVFAYARELLDAIEKAGFIPPPGPDGS